MPDVPDVREGVREEGTTRVGSEQSEMEGRRPMSDRGFWFFVGALTFALFDAFMRFVGVL